MFISYNGNLDEIERINQVAQEILKVYSFISFKDALKIAELESSISENVSNKHILIRLYNIMLICSYNKDIVFKVFQDFVKYLGSEKEFYHIAEAIKEYLYLDKEFPYLGEIYV